VTTAPVLRWANTQQTDHTIVTQLGRYSYAGDEDEIHMVDTTSRAGLQVKCYGSSRAARTVGRSLSSRAAHQAIARGKSVEEYQRAYLEDDRPRGADVCSSERRLCRHGRGGKSQSDMLEALPKRVTRLRSRRHGEVVKLTVPMLVVDEGGLAGDCLGGGVNVAVIR
jgi:hypothetical protein